MSTAAGTRSEVADALLDVVPKSVASALLKDEAFTRFSGTTTNATILVNQTIRFARSTLFDSVRRAFRRRIKTSTIQDLSGRNWQIVINRDSDDSTVLLISGSDRTEMPYFGLMASTAKARRMAFDRLADRAEISKVDRAAWRNAMRSSAPNDDLIFSIREDLDDSPHGVSTKLRHALRSGSLSIDDLAPASERYYRRLIGAPHRVDSMDDYVKKQVIPKVRSAMSRNAVDGFLECLRLCTHSSISDALASVPVEREDRMEVYRRLASRSNVLSRTAAIEIGMTRDVDDPELAMQLVELVRNTESASAESISHDFGLFSALVTLSFGQISRCKLLQDEKPFVRRQAAFVHAAGIFECLHQSNIDARSFIPWIGTVLRRHCLMQGLADLHNEPAFPPEGFSADQLRAEFAARIWLSTGRRPAFIEQHGLDELFGSKPGGQLAAGLHLALILFPGPMEGEATPKLPLADAQVYELKNRIDARPVRLDAILDGAVKALVLKIPMSILDHLMRAITEASFELVPDQDQAALEAALMTSARAAAVWRHEGLADALFSAVRRCRRLKSRINADTALLIGLVAAASRVHRLDWRAFVSNVIAEVAFNEIAIDDASNLLAHIRVLFSIEPNLWAIGAPAEAALASVALQF